jgi:hypothetical protein
MRLRDLTARRGQANASAMPLMPRSRSIKTESPPTSQAFLRLDSIRRRLSAHRLCRGRLDTPPTRGTGSSPVGSGTLVTGVGQLNRPRRLPADAEPAELRPLLNQISKGTNDRVIERLYLEPRTRSLEIQNTATGEETPPAIFWTASRIRAWRSGVSSCRISSMAALPTTKTIACPILELLGRQRGLSQYLCRGKS